MLDSCVDSCSVADPGCLSRIPDPTFFYPGSRIRTVSIPDPGSSSKNLSILTPKKAKKWFLSSKKYDPGCSSRIPDPDADFLPSRIQGSKRYPIPDPGLWIRIHFLRIWIRIQSLMLETNTDPDTDPDPDPIQYGSRALMTKNLKKITAENFFFFIYIKNCNLPIPRPP